MIGIILSILKVKTFTFRLAVNVLRLCFIYLLGVTVFIVLFRFIIFYIALIFSLS